MLSIAALVGGGLILRLAGPAAAGSGDTRPRVNTLPRLRPRVVTVHMNPRVVTLSRLQPRTRSVAPKRTSPPPASPPGTSQFTVNSDVLFAFDSASLAPDAQAVLAGVVQQLRTAPAGSITIDGYTDSIGTTAFNLTLSRQRAASVQTFLTTHLTNSNLTYSSQGFGEADPVAPNTLPNGNDNPVGRQQNRRVTITFTPA